MTVSLIGRYFSSALAVVALASCGKPGGSGRSPGGTAAARSIETATVGERTMSRSIVVSGSLAAQERSTLSAKVPGRLSRLQVDIGSVARKGDLLAEIERRDYELRLQQAAAALAQARASLGLPAAGDTDHIEISDVASVKQARAVLEEASKNRERVKNLSGLGIASQSELDTVEATYTVATARLEAAIEEARTRIASLAEHRAEYDFACKQLADTAITAPFDGAVQSRPATVGEYLAAGAPVVQLVKADPLRLRLEVPERQSLLIRTGQVVRLLVEGDTNAYGGHIARLSPALDDQTRMLLVEADVPSRGNLRAGLFARAEIVVKDDDSGLWLPPGAVVTFAGVEKVVGVREGKAVEKTVSTGRRGTDWVEILSGVKPGEMVVLNPGGLRTGQLVQLSAQPETKTASGAPTDNAKAR